MKIGSIDDAASKVKGRLMKLSPLCPWRAEDLYLITGCRSEKVSWLKREPVLDAVHLKSGSQTTFTDIGPLFALALFSKRR